MTDRRLPVRAFSGLRAGAARAPVSSIDRGRTIARAGAK